jgi:hypothetical protein
MRTRKKESVAGFVPLAVTCKSRFDRRRAAQWGSPIHVLRYPFSLSDLFAARLYASVCVLWEPKIP